MLYASPARPPGQTAYERPAPWNSAVSFAPYDEPTRVFAPQNWGPMTALTRDRSIWTVPFTSTTGTGFEAAEGRTSKARTVAATPPAPASTATASIARTRGENPGRRTRPGRRRAGRRGEYDRRAITEERGGPPI